MGAHERVPRRVVTRPLVGCASSAVSQLSVHVSVRSQDHDTTVQGCRAMSYIAMQMTCPLGEADELYKMRSKVGNVRYPLWFAAVGPRSDRAVVAGSGITST